MSDESLIRLCGSGDVEPDGVIAVEAPGLPTLAVFNLDGEFFVTDDLCTHGAASLADGFVEDGQIECPLHAGRFCIRTGAPTEAPCEEPLRTYEVVRSGDDVLIRRPPQP
ncbi:non-heme iron oxygenase ferredoxin subunit [Roseomonas sp. BN140053]|uniref:non-heme iron oxygenase ferredoxin subunit n=1 Tax=Roseomonas sp. BN140053 TaxID=3391898 RepID=UPI0039E9D08A